MYQTRAPTHTLKHTISACQPSWHVIDIERHKQRAGGQPGSAPYMRHSSLNGSAHARLVICANTALPCHQVHPHQNSFPRLIIQHPNFGHRANHVPCSDTVSTTKAAVSDRRARYVPRQFIWKLNRTTSMCKRAQPAHAPTSNANHRTESDETKASVHQERTGVPVSLTTLFHSSTQSVLLNSILH